MDLSDVFFLSMIFVSGIAAVIVVGIKFVKDMWALRKMDKVVIRSQRNMFKTNRNNKAMAVRNK